MAFPTGTVSNFPLELDNNLLVTNRRLDRESDPVLSSAKIICKIGTIGNNLGIAESDKKWRETSREVTLAVRDVNDNAPFSPKDIVLTTNKTVIRKVCVFLFSPSLPTS